MEKDTIKCSILIISPDPQYAEQLGSMLGEWIASPGITYACGYRSVLQLIGSRDFEAVILDTEFHGANKTEITGLFRATASLANVIIIAENFDVKFCNSTAHEIADFLEKSSLTSFHLYKSYVHAVKKSTMLGKLRDSRRKFGDIFRLSPLPMWIYDIETYNFFRVNDAAAMRYGYTKKEFKNMSFRGIRPQEDIPAMQKAVASIKDSDQLSRSGVFRHQTKHGAIVHVELISNLIYINGAKHRLVVVHDITERIRYIKEVEERNEQLQQIAHAHSHIVRAPLANMMGILQLMRDGELSVAESATLVESLLACGKQFDESICDIAMKGYSQNYNNR